MENDYPIGHVESIILKDINNLRESIGLQPIIYFTSWFNSESATGPIEDAKFYFYIKNYPLLYEQPVSYSEVLEFLRTIRHLTEEVYIATTQKHKVFYN